LNTKNTNNILFIIGISLFITGCPFKSGVERKAWFRYASEYDQARSKTLANAAADKKDAVQDLTKMSKLEQKFIQAKQPMEAEIISVLKSSNRRLQRVGLAAMSLKPIETDQLIDILFEFLQNQNPEFRWYAAHSLDKFKIFPESNKPRLERQLLEIIKNEKDQTILYIEISLLVKFPTQETFLILTELMMKEDKENNMRILKFAAFKTLKEMGDSYYDEAAEYINTHGSLEIKKEFVELEKAWVGYKGTKE